MALLADKIARLLRLEFAVKESFDHEQ